MNNQLKYLPKGKVTEFEYDEFGNVTREIETRVLYNGDRISTESQREAYKERKRIDREFFLAEQKKEKQQQRQEQLRGKHFVKCYAEKIKELIMVSPDTAGDVIDLIVHLKRGSNVLVKGGIKMNFEDVKHALGKGETATREFLKTVGKDGFNIIHTQSEGLGKANYYTVNEAYHKVGSDEKVVEFVKLYKKKYEELTKDLKQKEKGIIYKIIPYFHINKYCLCKNPLEPDEDKIEYFGLVELANAIGVKKGTMSKYINALKDNGIVAQLETGKMKAFIVHPDLMFRKDVDDDEGYTNTIRILFERNMRFAEQQNSTQK